MRGLFGFSKGYKNAEEVNKAVEELMEASFEAGSNPFAVAQYGMNYIIAQMTIHGNNDNTFEEAKETAKTTVIALSNIARELDGDFQEFYGKILDAIHEKDDPVLRYHAAKLLGQLVFMLYTTAVINDSAEMIVK